MTTNEKIEVLEKKITDLTLANVRKDEIIEKLLELVAKHEENQKELLKSQAA